MVYYISSYSGCFALISMSNWLNMESSRYSWSELVKNWRIVYFRLGLSQNVRRHSLKPFVRVTNAILQHGELNYTLDMLVLLTYIVGEKCVFICLPSCLFARNERDCALQFFRLCLPTVWLLPPPSPRFIGLAIN